MAKKRGTSFMDVPFIKNLSKIKCELIGFLIYVKVEKRTSRKKGLRVKSSEANMFIKHICLFSSLDLLVVSYKLWHGVFLFQFNKKDTNLPVKKI